MYEERAPEIYTGKPYWFSAVADDFVFWISFSPVQVEDVSEGYCFPGAFSEKGPNDRADDSEKFAYEEYCSGRRWRTATAGSTRTMAIGGLREKYVWW